MRTQQRYPVLQRCFVHLVRDPLPEAWRCVAYNISTAGIGIALPCELQKGTLLAVHPWNLPKAGSAQARVVQAKQVQAFWFTGCEWVERLSDDDLMVWRSEPTDWLDAPARRG
jgi:hypothetical protein